MINKGRFGIIAAMPVEAELITAAMEEKRTETVGGITFTIGMIRRREETAGQPPAEAEIVCAVCGIGKVYAAMCARP